MPCCTLIVHGDIQVGTRIGTLMSARTVLVRVSTTNPSRIDSGSSSRTTSVTRPVPPKPLTASSRAPSRTAC